MKDKLEKISYSFLLLSYQTLINNEWDFFLDIILMRNMPCSGKKNTEIKLNLGTHNNIEGKKIQKILEFLSKKCYFFSYSIIINFSST